MILRPAGASPTFNPPAPHHRSKLSPEAMTAIAMSLAFHGCVGVYLYAHHFVVMDLPAPPAGDPPVIVQTVTFPFTPPPPAPREKRQTPHQQAKEPIHVHQATPSFDTGPTLEVPAGPPGAGSGQGFADVISTPPTPGPTVARPKTILNPAWIHKPSGSQLADAYPDRLLERGIAGSAVLLCTVGVKGEVRDCTVAEETPRGSGFGAAALKLSRWFSIRPQTEDGQPVDGALVRVPISFGVG